MSGLCPSAMIGLVFLLFPALLCSQSAASGNTLPAKIFTIPGQTVVLPLHRRITSDFPTVEWSKQGLDQYVIVFRDGRESDDLQNPVFRGRASLFKDQLKDGNISLKISDVQENDAGTYRCKLLQNQDQDNVEFELVVGVASEPTLTFVPAADGQVTLQCDSGCWFPCPNITFLDDRGEEIGAKEQKNEPRSGKCCSATRTVALETVTSRVSCQVHQKEMNQMRLTEMFIPAKCLECTCPCTCTAVAAAAAAAAAVVAIVLIAVGTGCVSGSPCLRQKGDKAVRSPETSSGSTNVAEFNVEYMNRLNAEKENMQREIDKLTKEINDLKASQSLQLWESGSVHSEPSSPTDPPRLDPLSSPSPQRRAQSTQTPSSPAAAEKPLVRLPDRNAVKTQRPASTSGRPPPNNNVNRRESGSSRTSRAPQPPSPTGTPPLDPLSLQGPKGPAQSMDNISQSASSSAGNTVNTQRAASMSADLIRQDLCVLPNNNVNNPTGSSRTSRAPPPPSPTGAPPLDPLSLQGPKGPARSMDNISQSPSSSAGNNVKTQRAASMSGWPLPDNNNANKPTVKRRESSSSCTSKGPQPASPTGTPLLDPPNLQRLRGPQNPTLSTENINQSSRSPVDAGRSPTRTNSFSLPRPMSQRTPSMSSNRYSLLAGLDEED